MFFGVRVILKITSWRTAKLCSVFEVSNRSSDASIQPLLIGHGGLRLENSGCG